MSYKIVTTIAVVKIDDRHGHEKLLYEAAETFVFSKEMRKIASEKELATTGFDECTRRIRHDLSRLEKL